MKYGSQVVKYEKQIGASFPPSVVSAIDEVAIAERRSRSNMILTLVEEALAARAEQGDR